VFCRAGACLLDPRPGRTCRTRLPVTEQETGSLRAPQHRQICLDPARARSGAACRRPFRRGPVDPVSAPQPLVEETRARAPAPSTSSFEKLELGRRSAADSRVAGRARRLEPRSAGRPVLPAHPTPRRGRSDGSPPATFRRVTRFDAPPQPTLLAETPRRAPQCRNVHRRHAQAGRPACFLLTRILDVVVLRQRLVRNAQACTPGLRYCRPKRRTSSGHTSPLGESVDESNSPNHPLPIPPAPPRARWRAPRPAATPETRATVGSSPSMKSAVGRERLPGPVEELLSPSAVSIRGGERAGIAFVKQLLHPVPLLGQEACALEAGPGIPFERPTAPGLRSS